MNKLIDIIVIQETIDIDIQKNIDKFFNAISKIKVKNTTIAVLHELSYLKYIAINKNKKNKLFAIKDNSVIIDKFCDLAKSKNIYILFPFYEVFRSKYYNTSILISSSGKIIAKYRKRNIPNETCYEEDYYFNKLKNEFPVVTINGFNIGLMICWDQWYSNSYIKLSKKNVDLILCPTSIGYAYCNSINISMSEEKTKWRNTIVANSLMINTPIVVVNRIGNEACRNKKINFWGSSFVTNGNGDITYLAGNKRTLHRHTIDLSTKRKYQKLWGFN